MEALSEFADANSWAIKAAANSLAILSGTMPWSGATNARSQSVITYTVAPRDVPGAAMERDPSRRFTLKRHAIRTPGDSGKVDRFALDWDHTVQPTLLAEHQKFMGLPNYTGVLPVMICVEGLSLNLTLYVPQFRRTTPAPSNEREYASDLVELCVRSINMDFPLRILTDTDYIAVPGRFSRLHGTWRWSPFFDTWDKYRAGLHDGLDLALKNLKHGASPPELMCVVEDSLIY